MVHLITPRSDHQAHVTHFVTGWAADMTMWFTSEDICSIHFQELLAGLWHGAAALSVHAEQHQHRHGASCMPAKTKRAGVVVFHTKQHNQEKSVLSSALTIENFVFILKKGKEVRRDF